MSDLFELVKDIPSYQAAERQGIHLTSKGAKYWGCCPIHGEKTPSMCFYANGSWYCFGCHKGGDVIRFYQEVLNLPAYEAAVALAEDFNIAFDAEHPSKPRPTHTVFDLERALERKRSEEWTYLCKAVHRANSILEKYSDASKADEAWASQEFITAIRARAYADLKLSWLWTASLVDLALEYKEDDNGGTG